MAEKNVKQAEFETAMDTLSKALNEKMDGVEAGVMQKVQHLLDEGLLIMVVDKVEGKLATLIHSALEDKTPHLLEVLDTKLTDRLKNIEFPAELALLEDIPALTEAPMLSEDDEALISAACEAYGIGDEFVIGANIDRASGEAVVVTHGGVKVRYRAGQKVETLTPIQVSGINPEAKRKAIAGKSKN